MKSLIQRVSQASVTVEGKVVGQIDRGVLVLLGLEKPDTEQDVDWHIKKLLELRIFPDAQDKMNLSVTDIQGDLLIVSQFTLAASCRKGTRPSFDSAMPPAQAERFYELYLARLRDATDLKVQTGIFGAMMDVALVNDGPVTFMLER
jgi:D-tyrosyl-tRNA(Tyr) deacylase